MPWFTIPALIGIGLAGGAGLTSVIGGQAQEHQSNQATASNTPTTAGVPYQPPYTEMIGKEMAGIPAGALIEMGYGAGEGGRMALTGIAYGAGQIPEKILGGIGKGVTGLVPIIIFGIVAYTLIKVVK